MQKFYDPSQNGKPSELVEEQGLKPLLISCVNVAAEAATYKHVY